MSGLAALVCSLFGEKGGEDFDGTIDMRSVGCRVGFGIERVSYRCCLLCVGT